MQIKFKIILIACFFIHNINAQNYKHSPYSKYGIGDLISDGSSYIISMGGTGIAVRPHNQINTCNPASYTSQDTLSFILAADLSFRYTNLLTSELSDDDVSYNLEYISLGFPIKSWWKSSVGIVPYSRVNYNLYDEDVLNNEFALFSRKYIGEGGFNEFFIGNAFEIFKNISIGFDIKYIFGTIKKTAEIREDYSQPYSASARTIENTVIKDFRFRFGMQYYKEIKEKNEITIGLTYEPKSTNNVSYDLMSIRTFNFSGLYYTDTTDISNIEMNSVTIPARAGVGISYMYDNKLIIGIDYIRQNWSKAIIENNNAGLRDFQSFKFGIEFIPVSPKERIRTKYWKRIHYHTGGYYTNTYIEVGGNGINERGVTVGASFPLKNFMKLYTDNMINFTYQYGTRGTTDNGLIKENYHNFTLGLSLIDFWFIKPKYD